MTTAFAPAANAESPVFESWKDKRQRQRGLYPRQREALQLLAAGYTYDQVSEHLGVKPGTARSYIAGAVLALGADSPKHAIELAQNENLI